MASLLDAPLATLLEDASQPALSSEAQAFVVRLARLAAGVVGTASATEVTSALATDSPESFLGAFASLVLEHSPRRPGRGVFVRGRIALAAALERHGGLWRANEAQERLGVTRATLQNWRTDGSVVALPLGDGSFGYPAAQFAVPDTDVERPRPLAAIAELTRVIGGRLTAAELVALLTEPQPAFGGRTGFELLRAGESESVIALVRHVVTPADEGAPTAGLDRGATPDAASGLDVIHVGLSGAVSMGVEETGSVAGGALVDDVARADRSMVG